MGARNWLPLKMAGIGSQLGRTPIGVTIQRPDDLAIGDGALGFWKALGKCYSETQSALLGAQDREHPVKIGATEG